VRKGSLLIVIPTYNEVDNIGLLLEEILREIPESSVYVVDDGSPDLTFEKCKEIANLDSRVMPINRGKKMGLASAFLQGFQFGLDNNYDLIAVMDADFSHRVEDLKCMFGLISDNPELQVIVGSRWIKGGSVKNWSWSRIYLSKGASFYARNLLSLPMRDVTAGFRIFRADFLRKLDFSKFESGGFCFHIEMSNQIALHKVPHLEVPIVFTERVNGASKMSFRIASESFYNVTKWAWKRLH
jgi:dolichol-phosphate mannosyltransferase